MLTHINIQNFAIVENLDLDIFDKLTVITGETGAGKSIMIDALGLALGNRAESGAVRHGASKAEIHATFDLTNIPAAHSWLQSRELDSEQECILRRVITSDGRSKAYINGRPTPLQELKQLAEILVSIHGQHEHQALLRKETHRQLLDEFSGHGKQTAAVAKAYHDWQEKQNQLEHFQNHAKEMQDRADLLRFQVGELEELQPVAGEIEKLEQEHKRLANVEGLLNLGQQAVNALSEGDETLLNQSQTLLQLLQQMTQQDDGIGETRDMIESACIQFEEASSSLKHYLDHLDIDPQRYQDVDNRLSAYFQLSRKHRVDSHQLAELLDQLQQELSEIDGGDEKLAQLEASAKAAKEAFLAQAETLSKSRNKHAKKLNKVITEKIQPLGMPGAEFQAKLDKTDPDHASQHGLDHIEFVVKTNPGQPMKPLNKVASGGELSRISLAIQVACAAKSNVATLIFDEVDVGIGGAVAQVVGQLLRQLGTSNQVICVTHLPQVAAQGHNHLHVNKQTSKKQTHTGIARLSLDEKVAEIARMLGGLNITDQTLAHARELIDESQSL